MTADSSARGRIVGASLVFLGACCYGLLATVIRLTYARGFSPAQVLGAQMTFGAIGLAAIAWPRATRIEPAIALRLVIAGIPTGLTGAFYYGALHALDSASLAIVLLFQFTWMGVLAESITDRRAPRLRELGAIALLLVGTALATGVLEDDLSELAPLGVALGLASAASYTAVIFVSGRVATQIAPVPRSALLALGSMLTVLVLHPPRFLVDGSLMHGLFLPSVATALLGPILPTLGFAVGVPRIGPAAASLIGAVELPAAMIAATLVLGEPSSPARWVGVIVILLGVALSHAHAAIGGSSTDAPG